MNICAAQLSSHDNFHFSFTKILPSALIKTSVTLHSALQCGLGLLQGGEVGGELCPHLPFPSIPTPGECKSPHPKQTSISPCSQCTTLQHLSSMNSLCLWHYVPFCTGQPLGGGGGGRRGEGQAVKQFPPSESHSDPHTGDWGLTPARQ